jgi:hypothetical protein
LANIILTSGGIVEGPPFAQDTVEETPMTEEAIFPSWYYAPTCLAGRVFASQQEVDAASSEGPWTRSLSEAQEAATKAPAAPAPEDEEPHARRSHR